MTRASSAVLIALLLPASAFASLGGTVASVDTDRVRTQSALIRIQQASGYSVHEMLTPTGTTIREYYGSNGVVFGVAWDGEWPPDLRQLLGAYFEGFQSSVQASRRAGRTSRRVAVDDNGLIVRASGHSRSSSGIAYAPALIPAGVTPDVVK
jgi:hypothetical protein